MILCESQVQLLSEIGTNRHNRVLVKDIVVAPGGGLSGFVERFAISQVQVNSHWHVTGTRAQIPSSLAASQRPSR